MHEEKAFSVVSNASPRRTETCAHVRTTSLWGGGGMVATKWPARVKKTKKKGPEICIGPYQFEPIRENSGERRPEHPASSRLRSQISPESSVIYKFIFRNKIKLLFAYKAVTIIIVYSYQWEI